MFSTLKSAIFICAMLIFFSAVLVEATISSNYGRLPFEAQDKQARPALGAPQEAQAVVVKMTMEHKFVPEKITVKVGRTVEWVSEDKEGTHEVTTDPDIAVDPSHVSMPDGAQVFDSHLILPGKSFRHQFTVAGLYRYSCPPHENDGMLGEVTVTK